MANEEKKISKLTPMDIHDKEFKRRGRNGYDRYEVDSFLDEIVDDYGDVLDQVVDLKNKAVSLEEKINNLENENNQLQSQVDQYKSKENELNSALVSAQTSAKTIKADAQKEADDLIANAKEQAKTDTEFERQQKETLEKDYDRLKTEVGQFRLHIKDLLKEQIDHLDDDQWQHALDKYFDTPRYYPEDGSEPIDDGDNYDLLADDPGIDEDEIDDADLGEPDHIDKEDLDALESEEEDDQNESTDPQPMTGDSPNHETVNTNTEPAQNVNPGPTIVFPDDYKDHK